MSRWYAGTKTQPSLSGAIYLVLSGVPQVSVLGPIFLEYINDLDEGVTGKIFKFADDTYLFRNMEIGDKQKLHDDIDKLVSWSENG